MKIVSFDFFAAASSLARANLPYQPIVANLNRKQRYLSHRYSKLESNNLPRNGNFGSDGDTVNVKKILDELALIN